MTSRQKAFGFLTGQYAKIILVAAFAAVGIAALRESYYLDVLIVIGIYFVLIMALDLIIGYTGQLSLGHTGFFAIAGYVSALLTLNLGLSPWLALVAGVVCNALIAFLLGLIVFRTRELYFATITLAFGMIVGSLAIALYDVTGGTVGIGGVKPLAVGDFEFDTGLRVAILVWVVAIAIFWLSSNIVGSRVGRAMRAIHTDEVAAQALGVDPMKYKMQVFVLSAMLASIAGSLYVHYRGIISPGMVDVVLLIQSLMMLFLGGVGTLWGGLLGVALLTLLPQMGTMIESYKILIYPVVFLVILLFLPNGLVGIFHLASRRLEGSGVSLSTGADLQRLIADGPILGENFDKTNTPRMDSHALEIVGLNRYFGGLQAVADLSFTVPPGTIQSLIGPNGAGKSTVLGLISGLHPPSSGEIRFQGKRITGLKPNEIAELKIGRTFQVPRLFQNMTLLDNVMVGCHTITRTEMIPAAFSVPSSRKEEIANRVECLRWLNRVGLGHLAQAHPNILSHGQKRWLELARVLACRPAFLLLDEPTSGLNETEKRQFTDFLVALKDNGMTMLLVEHDMNVVMGISDYIVVMSYGEKIAEGVPTEIQENEAVIAAYLG